MADKELVVAAMRAYKGPRLGDKIDPDSDGLEWLRVPMERVVDVLVPLVREQLAQEWMVMSHDVRFNRKADDLTPHQRVLKFIRGGYNR